MAGHRRKLNMEGKKQNRNICKNPKTLENP
jgi:hypothetical protein